MRTHKQVGGYTLIEMLVYAALFVIASVVIVDGLLVATRLFARTKETRLLRISAETAMERIIREIRLANAVDMATSTLGTSPGVLMLNTIDPVTETPTTIRFALAGGRITIKKSASPAEYLTSEKITVSNLVFSHILNGSVSQAARIEFTIGGKNFYSTAVLRRSYQ